MTNSGIADVSQYNPQAFSLKPRITPLQRILGIYDAEEYYDKLDLPDQLIVDLIAEGWQQQDIAIYIFHVNPSWVSVRLRQIRVVLANTKLRDKIDMKVDTRDVFRGQL